MKFGKWVQIGSLVLLMCAHQGDSTLILGSMLMAATAAMTGGLIMGPLTVGGLIMLMMMAANNNQNAQQRQQTSSTSNIASTLENSQNLLNLLATLTGAAGNLATSASTQQATYSSTNAPKAAKRALYNPNNFPQNLEELLAASSRQTATRRQWKSIPLTTTTTTTTTSRTPTARSNDFWNTKPTNYFSPDTGFAVEPIPDDLLDIAMRLPQAKNANMFGDLFEDGTVSTGSGSSTSNSAGTSGMDGGFSPPRPITSAEHQLRWVASEPGDLFSSFPEIREEDILNLVRKRATREALTSKFRLEDIANVTYANDKDPIVKEQLTEREKQEMINTRIFRQLSALDPFRCLPQLACNMQATPPSQQSGILNDYAYLVKTVFERDEDDEEDDEKSGSSSVKKQVNGGSVASGVASEILAVLTPQNKRKKKLDYKSPSKGEGTNSTSTASRKKKKSDNDDDDKQDDKNDDDDDDDDDDGHDGFSSEEIPMDEDELDRLLIKEQYEMEQAANEELLNDDPDLLPYVLKSASKGPPYLGPDVRVPSLATSGASVPGQSDLGSSLGSGPSALPPSGPSGIGGRIPGGPSVPLRSVGRGPAPAGPSGPGPRISYAQPPPLFSVSKLTKYRTEDLNNLSSKELNNLLREVTYPEEEIHIDEGTFGDNRGSLSEIISSWVPLLPQVAVGFTRRRTHTGNAAFDDDPFFDDFDLRRRSLNFNQPGQQPKLRKVRRVVRKVKESGAAGRVAYLRRMKRMLDSERDPAVVFKMATEIGAKVKSSRQCRFLFNGCPLNSTQLLGMIGNIRKAVVGLSNAQQLFTGNVNLAALTKQAQQQQQTPKDFEQNLATIGPNVVTFPTVTPTPATTVAPPSAPAVHQLTPMAPVQMVQPILGMPQHPPPQPQPATSQSSQNTIVVPQIVQVPMPIHSPPPPQQPPIYVQQSVPNMPHHTQQMHGLHSHPVFNVVSDPASQGSGLTSISHELPSGEKVEISMKLTGQHQSDGITIPLSATKPRPKPSIPLSAQRPTQAPIQVQVRPVQESSSRPIQIQAQTVKMRNPAADLVDLFDDDNADNYLLPSKTLIETEIREPSTSLDSLQAAILAIEKINQAASDKKKARPSYLEDDETELDTKFESHLVAALKRNKPKVPATTPRPTTSKTTTTKKIVPAGLRQPISKTKGTDQADEESDDDETSEEDDEDEDEEEYRYRTRLPDPLDPKRREFVPVPTKETQFQEASQLTVPATQTFVKKHLQVQDSVASSSEEDEQPSQRRMLASVTRRKVRRPRILYPQEDIEKPVFIPL